TEAIAEYRRLLAADVNPDELVAGLREWGSGEARIISAELVDDDGEARSQFASGEPITVRLRVAADPGVAPPRVSLELRDDGGLVLGAAAQDTSELGWNGGGERDLTYRLARLALADAASGRLLHTLDDAVRFFVFPTGEETGAILLDGRWALQEIGEPAPTRGP